MGYDTDGLKRSVSLSETAALYGVKLHKSGKDEFEGLCPFHAEKTPSFQIFIGDENHQVYHCKGCGASGDVIQFVEQIKGVSFQDACEILGGKRDAPDNRPPVEYKRTDFYEGIEPLPVEEHSFVVGEWADLYNPKKIDDRPDRKIKPSLIHEYRDKNGDLFGLVLRQDLPGGRKETPMVRFVRLPDGREVWSRFPFSKPRPLYGLDGLSPDKKQVIIVEGEKARDHLTWTTGRCVVTWPGGTNGTRYVDWTPLKGKDIILWPDYDDPGKKVMIEGDKTERREAIPVAKVLHDLGCRVRWVDMDRRDWSEPLPNGHDAADLDWSKAEIDQLMKDCIRSWQPANQGPEPPDDSPEPAPIPTGEASPAISQVDETWMQRLTFNDDGALVKTSNNNHLSFLEHHPDLKGVIAFNSFKHQTILVKRPPWEWLTNSFFEQRPIEDVDYPRIAQYMEQNFRLTPKPKALETLVDAVAKANAFDPLDEYLRGLRWDGVPRCARLLVDYFGCEDTDYANIISRRFVISAVARALEPGCKMDTMLILEGPQGARKSSAIRALFGDDFFSDHISDVESKDAMMEQQGIWCLEVGEMHSFTKKEANAVKKFMVQQVDRFRPPYGRNIVTAPRRSLMVGTINPDGAPYLKDPTGARRFWPIAVDYIDIDRLRADRDQIWAEALSMYKHGNPWWVQEEEEELVQLEQQARTAGDIWEGVLEASIKHNTRLDGTYQLRDAIAALHLPMDRATNMHFDRIAKVLSRLGWKLVAGSTTEFRKAAA